MNYYTYIDAVAKPLEWAIDSLTLKNIKYVVNFTRPKRPCAILDEKMLYVIRQQIDADGVYILTAAASIISVPKN